MRIRRVLLGVDSGKPSVVYNVMKDQWWAIFASHAFLGLSGRRLDLLDVVLRQTRNDITTSGDQSVPDLSIPESHSNLHDPGMPVQMM